VPPGADAYLLSRIVHDLGRRGRGRDPADVPAGDAGNAALLLVATVLPERAADHPPSIRMDLHMFALMHGRERTVTEYAQLLRSADLELTGVVPADPESGVHLLEARPADVSVS
jgi:hypothetical protein